MIECTRIHRAVKALFLGNPKLKIARVGGIGTMHCNFRLPFTEELSDGLV
jgi:hypothetical protein